MRKLINLIESMENSSDIFNPKFYNDLKLDDIVLIKQEISNKIDKIKIDLEKITKRKSELFQESIGEDQTRKSVLYKKLKLLDTEAITLIRKYHKEDNKHVIISNLEMIIVNKDKIKNNGLWEQIIDLEPAKFKKILSRKDLFEPGKIEKSDEFERQRDIEMMKAWDEIVSVENKY